VPTLLEDRSVTERLTALQTYRKIFASAADEEVCWWYFGFMYAELPGWPQLPVMQTATIMVYRTETVSDQEVKIRYREIGYFRDPITGAMPEVWVNPVTGTTVDAARSFREGPSCYTVRQTGAGVELSLEQAHAHVTGLDAAITSHGERIMLTQNEYKARGFPGPDGRMSAATSNGHTTLSFFANARDIRSNLPSVAATGTYRFTLDKLPIWLGFGDAGGQATVVGLIRKAAPTERVSPHCWGVMRELFPDFFHGDAVRPAWG
jgi:hypothetical protein